MSGEEEQLKQIARQPQRELIRTSGDATRDVWLDNFNTSEGSRGTTQESRKLAKDARVQQETFHHSFTGMLQS